MYSFVCSICSVSVLSQIVVDHTIPVLGAMGNMLWFSSAQKISAQTGYVMDGMQEAVGELIVAVKVRAGLVK